MVSKPGSRAFCCSSRSHPCIFLSAEMTVEWLRSPKWRPISLYAAPVCLRQVHGQHPGIDQGTGATVRFQCLRIDLEELAYRALDVTQADGCAV